MPDSRLSLLPAGSAIVDADLFYSDQSGVSVKQPGSAFKTYLAGAGITINTTPILGGLDRHVLYDNAGTIGEASNLIIRPTAGFGIGCPDIPTLGAYFVQGQAGLYRIANASGDNWFEGSAGNITLTGYQNFGTGANCLASVTSGFENTGMGFGAMQFLNTGSQNTAIGSNALQNSSSAIGNVAVGTSALNSCTTGQQNFAFGIFSLQSITSDGGHVAIGGNALSHLTGALAGGPCVAVGGQALNNDISGGGNVAIGNQALQSLNTGTQNVAIGSQVLTFCDDSNNTAVGYQAAFGTGSGSYNVCVGSLCGHNWLAPTNNNTWLGAYDTVGRVSPSNTIVISTGITLQLDYGWTVGGQWTFAALASAGLMTTNASGTVAIANAAPAASVPANFAANNRIQVNIGGTTYYIPCETTPW